MQEMLNKIILGDCLDIMRTMPDKCVDLVLTDPPYGINKDTGSDDFGTTKSRKYKGGWDSKIPEREYFNEIIRVSKNQIIFGGNYFTMYLPITNSWIVWDKVGEIQFDNPFSDCELAWTSFKFAMKKITCIQQGFINEDKSQQRIHATQKPARLFSDIVRQFSKESDIIFDPFIGSGTTAVACIANNRQFIGIEKDPEYHRLATERVEKEKLNLFNTGGIE